MKLRLSDALSLPLDAATQTLLVVGKRGSGKSSTATRFAEQLIGMGVRIAVLDPVDVWWGLKAGADGQREGGLEVYVFGGKHADLPLEPTAGALMADVLVDNRINAVMVVREFSNRDKARFVSAFAERLFQRNQDVLHLICEEAHEVMPQQPYKGEEEMLGRMLKLQKLGRTSGIGMSSITQRPASLNKNATTQAEILVAHRLLGPQDIAAIEGWIKHHHVEELKQQVLSTLPELKTGEAWVWAPDFPEEKPIGLQRVHMLLPETFDSRRTPKPGERRTEPKQLAAVDLEKLRTKMAATIERAKLDDPMALRMRIVELERALKSSQSRTVFVREKQASPKMISVPVLREAQIKRLQKVAAKMDAAVSRFAEDVSAAAKDVRVTVEGAKEIVRQQSSVVISGTPKDRFEKSPSVERASKARNIPVGRVPGEESLGRGKRKILAAVAQYPDGVTRKQLTVLTGFKRSTRDTYLQRLRADGYVEGEVRATRAGIAALGDDYAPLPTGAALREHWLSHLPEGERKILEILMQAWPDKMERDGISEATGYARSSRDSYLQRLRARELIVANGRGPVRAAEMLFEGER